MIAVYCMAVCQFPKAVLAPGTWLGWLICLPCGPSPPAQIDLINSDESADCLSQQSCMCFQSCSFSLKKAITLWVGLRFVQILLMLISWQLCVSAILWMWMCLASWHIRHSLLLFILNVFCCAYLHIQVSQLRWQITSMSVMGAQFLWPSAISHWDKTCFFCPRESFDTWDRIPWLLYCQPFGLFVQHDPVFNFLGTVKIRKDYKSADQTIQLG